MSNATVSAIAISSVVPPARPALEEMSLRYFGIQALFIEATMDLGMPVRYHPPADVGADRIVNAVAAYHEFGGPVIVVDFGTATTLMRSPLKGSIWAESSLPVIGISAEALFIRAARLPARGNQAAVKCDRRYHDRQHAVGPVLGVRRIGRRDIAAHEGELENPYVVSTGGLAELIFPACAEIDSVEKNLTLEGMRLIHERLK